MYRFIKGLIALAFLVASLLTPSQSYAASIGFDIFPPEGQLTRGQDVTFTVTIDTKGASVSSTQIGVQYETQYLQYVSFTPGETMGTISAQDIGGGKLLLSGSDSAGYKGSGKFAYITFKLIASAPGNTNLCALFAPTTTTSAPTTAPTTTAPIPTKLPKSGVLGSTPVIGIFGGLFVLFAGYLFISSHLTRAHHSGHNLKKRKSP